MTEVDGARDAADGLQHALAADRLAVGEAVRGRDRQEAVAIARHPGTEATVRALAASQTLTSTRIAGSSWSRRSSCARSRKSSGEGLRAAAGTAGAY